MATIIERDTEPQVKAEPQSETQRAGNAEDEGQELGNELIPAPKRSMVLPIGAMLWLSVHGLMFGWSMLGTYRTGADAGGLHIGMGLLGFVLVLCSFLPAIGAIAARCIVGSEVHWYRPVAWIVAGVCSVYLLFQSSNVESRLLEKHLPGVEAAAIPLIEAIEAYERDQGKLPVWTKALMPSYLAGLPPTTILRAKEFIYEKDRWRSMPGWSLRVSHPHGYYAYNSSRRIWSIVRVQG